MCELCEAIKKTFVAELLGGASNRGVRSHNTFVCMCT